MSSAKITAESARAHAEWLEEHGYHESARGLLKHARAIASEDERDRYAEIIGDLMLQADACGDYAEWCKVMGHAVLDRLEADGRLVPAELGKCHLLLPHQVDDVRALVDVILQPTSAAYSMNALIESKAAADRLDHIIPKAAS